MLNATALLSDELGKRLSSVFLRNDDWPEDRDALARTDPAGSQMIRHIWNV